MRLKIQEALRWLLRWLGVKPKVAEEVDDVAFAERYADISKFNLTAVVANKVATVAVADATIEVGGVNARAVLIGDAVQRCVDGLRPIAARALGVGGVVLKPWVMDGKLYLDVLDQTRLIVLERRGETVAKAAFLAAVEQVDGRTYERLEVHTLAANGVYTIQQKAECNGHEVPLDKVPSWAGLPPEQTITNVKQPLWAYLRCPTANRKAETAFKGVPVTFGCETLMDEIVEALAIMQREMANKEAFIGADVRLFSKGPDGKERILPGANIFKKLDATVGVDDKPFFEVFSPDIRTQQMVDMVNFRLSLLEKAIGVNKGVLTDLDNTDGTATAIKRSTFDTFALVDALRKNIEATLDGYAYACDVLATVNRLAPSGKYELNYDWSYALIEDSAESFEQLRQGAAMGVIRPEEVRAYITGEDVETAAENLPIAVAE